MLQLYGNPRSRAMRCLWMLEEMGEPSRDTPVLIDGHSNVRRFDDWPRMIRTQKLDSLGFFAWKCRITAASVRGIEIASATSPLGGIAAIKAAHKRWAAA